MRKTCGSQRGSREDRYVTSNSNMVVFQQDVIFLFINFDMYCSNEITSDNKAMTQKINTFCILLSKYKANIQLDLHWLLGEV